MELTVTIQLKKVFKGTVSKDRERGKSLNHLPISHFHLCVGEGGGTNGRNPAKKVFKGTVS